MLFGIISSKTSNRNTADQIANELSSQGDIELIWEEDFSDLPAYPFDVLYTQPSSLRGINLTSQAEERQYPVINGLPSIMIALGRMVKTSLFKNAGLLVPQFICAYPAQIPFEHYVAKGLYDLHTGIFATDHVIVDKTNNLEPVKLPNRPVFAQEHIPSEWEYKVIAIGKESWLMRRSFENALQRMQDSFEVLPMRNDILELAQMARKIVGLHICSIDFLEHENQLYLIDINFFTGFSNTPEGTAAIARLLVETGTKG